MASYYLSFFVRYIRFLDRWEIIGTVPLLKKNNSGQIGNYRPILSKFCNVYEDIISTIVNFAFSMSVVYTDLSTALDSIRYFALLSKLHSIAFFPYFLRFPRMCDITYCVSSFHRFHSRQFPTIWVFCEIQILTHCYLFLLTLLT